jgi:hypothetical protein
MRQILTVFVVVSNCFSEIVRNQDIITYEVDMRWPSTITIVSGATGQPPCSHTPSHKSSSFSRTILYGLRYTRFAFSVLSVTHKKILRETPHQTAMMRLAPVKFSVASITLSFLKRSDVDERMMASSSAEKRMDVCLSSMAERTRFL